MNNCDLCGKEGLTEFTVKSKHLRWILSEDLQKLDTHKNNWLTKNICENCFKKIFGKSEEDEFSELKKAYGEGKTIQHMNLDGEWVDCDMPVSFVSNHSYRIKPEENYTIEQNTGENRIESGVLSISGSVEKQYRPFNNCGELIEYWYDFTGVINCSPKLFMPTIWVKHKRYGTENLITAFDNDNESIGGSCVFIQDIWVDMKELFDNFTFCDGSPCGSKEE